jgi:hypothetical protein
MNFFRQCGVVIVLGALVACSSAPATHPRPAPPPPAAAHASANGAPPALSSPPRFAAGRESYNISSIGTIGLAAGGATAPDTVQTDALVQFNAEWTSTGLDVTGTVVWRVSASGALAGGPAAAAAMSSVSLDPVPFRAMVDTARSAVRFASDSVEGGGAVHCPAPNAAALATVRELLSNVPRSLAPGSSWVDTLVTTTCRGELPVTSTAVRKFTVTLERSSTASEGVDVLVKHTSAVDVRGQASGRDHAVSITGTGTGQTSQHYTPLTGRLLSATSVSDLDLTVGLPGRGAALHQHAESLVRPVGP